MPARAASLPSPLTGGGSFTPWKGGLVGTTGWEPPDIIEFVVSDKYLDRAYLFPRQGTLLKAIFLQTELFTQYDYDVLGEWAEDFERTGLHGVSPDIFERIQICKSQGRRWFHEVVSAIGRRGSKGHIGGIAGSYVLWTYMGKGDPQGFYGIDRDKQLAAFVYAAKKEQAILNQWGDLANMITGGPCFAPWISKALGQSLTVFAPNDMHRLADLQRRGIESERDIATFLIQPKESTLTSGRGPASFLQMYDEMAHVVPSGTTRDIGQVYDSAKPALDQFGYDGFIYEPSSTWTMVGKFFENAQQAIARENNAPLDPSMLLIQLESWDPYLDWEHARSMQARPHYRVTKKSGDTEERSEIRFKKLVGAISSYDYEMQLEERKNPDSFAVERRSHWATVLDAYLNPDKIEKIWLPWPDEDRVLEMQTQGRLAIAYKAHGDPSKSGANFGFAMGHTEASTIMRMVPGFDEPQEVPVSHVVFDVITAWRPEDYDEHDLPYLDIEDDIFEKYIVPFQPEEVTFDQFNSIGIIASLARRARADQRIKKHINVFEKTATRPLNWRKAETFKAALNLEFVHAPYFELADLELRFLQEVNGAVDHPTSGPVQTKDVADCMFDVVHSLVGDQMATFVGSDLASLGVRGALPGGTGETYRDPVVQQLAQSTRRPNARNYQAGASRGGRFAPQRGYQPSRGRPF